MQVSGFVKYMHACVVHVEGKRMKYDDQLGIRYKTASLVGRHHDLRATHPRKAVQGYESGL